MPNVRTLTADTEYDWVGIYVFSGQAFNNLTFYPMLRDAAIKDDTYVPYAKTNREITEELSDTGWLNSVTNSKISGGGGLSYRRKNGIVFMTMGVTISEALSANTWNEIATLPEGFRPSINYQNRVEINDSDGLLYVSPQGVISVKPYVAVVANKVVRGSISYPI